MVDFTSEQQFLGAPESDRLLAFGMALATELCVTRARLHRMEARLQDAGILSTGELDACPNDAMRSEIQPELERFVESLMNTLMGAQASVPASNDILQQFK